MVRDVVLYHFGFGNDVTGYEFVGYLVTFDERIEEYTAFEVIEQGVFGLVGKPCHVFEVDIAVFVEGCGKGFFGGIDMGQLVLVEGYGMVEDVGFECLTVFVAF